MTIEIVDFPIRNGDFRQQNVSHYQRVYLISNEGSPQYVDLEPHSPTISATSRFSLATGYHNCYPIPDYTQLHSINAV